MNNVEMIITSRDRDIGEFSVRRLLPYATHRMVGPYIFFDHMGPAEFEPGAGMTVRPHPHIGLATVTYLFEGSVHHRDSLGSDQIIRPGDINWMTAGHGIVHSERTPAEIRNKRHRMNGIQLWVALPAELENAAPTFVHHPGATLPSFDVEGVPVKLMLGEALGRISPVKVHSDMFYFEARLKPGQKIKLPDQAGREVAAYVVSGRVRLEEKSIDAYSMIVAKDGEGLEVEALEETCVVFLGGAPVGKRFIYWNFVASSREILEQAKLEWAQGPGTAGTRFHKIAGDDREFIPLPVENVKATIM